MEAAAAAIAVITVSLQSTKLIYQTVEEIRNGPAVVAELASRTRKLDALLQQLLDLICHSQRSITTQDQHLWKSLEHEILQCSDYLNKAADKIKKLDSSLSSHPIEKTWRRIKVSLKDKDLERMSEQMQNYVAMLNTQLHIINSRLCVSREVYERRQLDKMQDSLRETSTQLSLESANCKDLISHNARKVNEDLMRLTAAMHDFIERQDQSPSLTRKVIQNTSHLLVEQMNNNHADLRRNTDAVSGNITTRLERLENLSTEQFEEIIDRLRQIELQSSPKQNATDTNSAGAHIPEVEQDPEASFFAKHDLSLSAAIDRLCLLASNTDTVCYSKDAENIIDDLGCVLDAIMNQDIRAMSGNSRGGKRKRGDQEQSHDLHRNIKRVHGILSASQAVELNRNNSTRHRRDTRSERIQMKSKHLTRAYNMVDCTAVVSIRTDTHSVSERQAEPKRLHIEDALRTMRGSISILPNTNLRRFKISLSFLQRLTSSGFSCVNPGLFFHPIVPMDAEIFEAVETGDVDWMLELLNAGKASLQDCDSEGRSLLNYAIAHHQLTSCRFLVRRGADVNSLERPLYDDGDGKRIYTFSLDQQDFNDSERDVTGDQLQDYLAIKQCLLEHDADPVSITPDSDNTMFEICVMESRPDVLSTTLKYGRGLIDLSERDHLGRNYILQMLAWCPYYRGADVGKQVEDDVIRKIQILHSHGVDIGSKDDCDRGCLHTLLDRFLSLRCNEVHFEDRAQMIISTISYLIEIDAYIYAVDEDGWSVTETAHHSRLGRLWEVALEHCGLDIQQVYLNDHNSALRYSDDIYAPDKNHPRQVRLLDPAYYDWETMDLKVQKFLLYERLDRSENAQGRVFDLDNMGSSEDDDSKASDWSEEVIIEDYNEESCLSFEQRSQIAGEDQPDASAEEESSDEDTGGVPITI